MLRRDTPWGRSGTNVSTSGRCARRVQAMFRFWRRAKRLVLPHISDVEAMVKAGNQSGANRGSPFCAFVHKPTCVVGRGKETRRTQAELSLLQSVALWPRGDVGLRY